MPTIETFVADQLAVLAELRAGRDSSLPATDKQIRAVNILLTAALGSRANRHAILRRLLGYDERFQSTKQLTYADAHALLEWAYQGQSPAKGVKPGMMQQIVLSFLRVECEQSNTTDHGQTSTQGAATAQAPSVLPA